MSNEISNRFEDSVRVADNMTEILGRTSGLVSIERIQQGECLCTFQQIPSSREISIGLAVGDRNNAPFAMTYDLNIPAGQVTVRGNDDNGNLQDGGFTLTIYRLNSTDGDD